MGVTKELIAYRLLEEFQKTNSQSPDTPLTLLAKTLQSGKRPLGDKHFQQAHDFLMKIMEVTPLVVHSNYIYQPELHIQKRRMFMGRTYMGFPKGQPNYFLPVQMVVDITHNSILASSRNLPVIFDHQHVEKRHIEHSGIVLDWKSREIDYSIFSGLAISYVLGRKMQEGKIPASIPVALPETNGLYLGQADFSTHDTFAAECIAENFKIFSPPKAAKQQLMHSSPLAALLLRTFVPMSNFSEIEWDLHSRFMQLFKQTDIQKGLFAYKDNYACSFVAANDYDCAHISNLDREFTSIIDSDLWKKNSEISLPHVRPVEERFNRPSSPANTENVSRFAQRQP